MLASTFFDPVLGIDVHIVGIPAPPAPAPIPTPIPMPFVGMVFDPMGLATGAAMGMALGGSPGLVLVNGLPATNCGTNVTNMLTMPHLPAPGVMFIPPPKPGNDAELLFGALNVSFAGSLAVRLGDIALSCSDPVRLPTSLVLAIPKGLPVLVLRPPVPDVNLIAQMLLMKGALHALGALVRAGKKLFRVLRKAQRNSKRLGRASDAIHALVNRIAPERLRSRLHNAVCFVTGHPVDVATGRMFTDAVDLKLPGAMPLVFKRTYDSSLSWRRGTLGWGWSHSLDQEVWAERGKVVYRAEDGREIEFDTTGLDGRTLRPGQRVHHPLDRLVLRARGELRWEIETRDGVVHEFAPVPGAERGRAKILRTRDRLGYTIEYGYDARGLLTRVRDAAGREVGLEHDAERRLRAIVVPDPHGAGRHVHAEFRYDARGDLVEVIDAFGRAARFEYVTHLMVQETDRAGLSVYFQWHGTGSGARCIRTWGDGGIYDHEIRYDAANRKTFVENSLGHTTTYELDEVGQVVAVTDPLGGVTRYAYDGRNGQRCKETGPDGAETVWTYDERGNAIETVRPGGAAVRVEYDERNLPLRAVDANGGEHRWSYDDQGRQLAVIEPLGRRTEFRWDGRNLAAVVDPSGEIVRLRYDRDGNLAAIVEPDGGELRWEYDRLGQCVSSMDEGGNLSTREHDRGGRLTRLREPDGNVRELEYDAEDRLVHLRDRERDVRFEYRGMAALVARTEAGTRVEFEYDTEERLVCIRNEHQVAWRFARGATGLVDVEEGFDGVRRRFLRDEAGRVVRLLGPEGRATAYAYDAAGQLVAVRYADGRGAAFRYRADGALMAAINENAAVQLERDELGRITREVQGEDWVASRYGVTGARTRLLSSKGLDLAIERDASGRPRAVRAEVEPAPPERGASPGGPAAPFEVRFLRDRLGLEIERSFTGGLRARWRRDPLGRPIAQEVWTGAERRLARELVWEGEDRLRRVVDALRGPVRYTYDAVGNLAEAIYADGQVDRRLPDAVGNLFRRPERDDRTYGPTGQLLEARGPTGVTRYAYDADGNLRTRTLPDGRVWTYAFDAAGMLAAVVRPDGAVVEFGYDALGRRVWKRHRGRTTRWIWDQDVPLHEWVEPAQAAEVAASGGVAPALRRAAEEVAVGRRAALLEASPAQAPPPAELPARSPGAALAGGEGSPTDPITWLFEPETFTPLAKLVGGRRYGIVADHVGAPVAMYDEAGRSVWSAEMGVYGDLRTFSGERGACPFRWPGQYEDSETGLCYNRFRYYDPDSGTFVSPDPIGVEGGGRPYSYVQDPNTWIDPLGWVPGPASLPDRPGVYIITAGSDSYVGSAGMGEDGMRSRISRARHEKAQRLLATPGATVEFVEVRMGRAVTRSDRNNILRFYENREYKKQVKAGFNMLNDKPIQAADKVQHARDLIKQHGVRARRRAKCT